eukprot:6203305-Pleurochrysis_carterae.AAC.2
MPPPPPKSPTMPPLPPKAPTMPTSMPTPPPPPQRALATRSATMPPPPSPPKASTMPPLLQKAPATPSATMPDALVSGSTAVELRDADLEKATENIMGEGRLRRATRSSTKMEGAGALGGGGTHITVVDQRPVEAAARTLMTALRGGHRPSAIVHAF